MKKIENSPFDPWVKRVFPKLLPYTPDWLTANRITLIGLAGSALACLCLYLSRLSPAWCVAGAFFVWLHWFADTLDGEVARARGPSRLGYYLDHFSDSISVVLIGIGAFLTPGAHILIGLWIVVFYLLMVINGLIKAELTRTMELPWFGPTEIHFSLVVLLVLQAFVQFGQPLEWLPGLTGSGGYFPTLFGSSEGFTLIDHAGLVILAGLVVLLPVEFYKTARVFLK